MRMRMIFNRIGEETRKLKGFYRPWELLALAALASIFYGIHLISKPYAFIIAGVVGVGLYCLHEISILFTKKGRG